MSSLSVPVSTVMRPSRLYSVSGQVDTTGQRMLVCPSSVTEARQFTFSYEGTLIPGWKVVKRLELVVERDSEGWYIVSDDVFLVYGVGPTWAEAFSDYQQSLVESYLITERSAQTNEYDRPVLDVFRSFISRNPQPGSEDVSKC